MPSRNSPYWQATTRLNTDEHQEGSSTALRDPAQTRFMAPPTNSSATTRLMPQTLSIMKTVDLNHRCGATSSEARSEDPSSKTKRFSLRIMKLSGGHRACQVW